MSLIAERDIRQFGEEVRQFARARGMEDHDRDLVQELGKRLDAIWRYDQKLANADGKDPLEALWRDLKSQDLIAIQRIKDLIRLEIEEDCF